MFPGSKLQNNKVIRFTECLVRMIIHVSTLSLRLKFVSHRGHWAYFLFMTNVSIVITGLVL